MTEPRNIKVISAKAEKTVKYKSKLAMFVIWLFSMLAMAFIFFDNIDFLKMPAKRNETSFSSGKKPLPVKQNTAGTLQNGNQPENESFVLVQYNKKLILTRYSVFSSKSDAPPSVQNDAPSSPEESKPVLIKRPKNKPVKEEFFIKSVPQ